MRRRCSLCGGKLNGNICTECGLDNSKNDDQYVTLGKSGHEESLTHIHTEAEKPYEGKTMTRENVRKAKNADKNAKKAAAKKASKNAAAGKVNPAGRIFCSKCELQYRRHKLQPDRKPELQLYIIFNATKQQTGKKEKEAWKVSDRLCDHCSICR